MATHLIFDLDNTLYPPACGVVARVDVRINGFMRERLGIDPVAVDDLRERYRRAYGTTLHGLMRHHAVEPDDYLEAVHAIELDDVLAPDRALAAMLAGLPHRKTVFTNGSGSHAERVLARLGVRLHFGDVFGLERVAYVPKPQAAGFRTVLDILAAPPGDCVFIDDDLRNLATARRLGMSTVLVRAPASNDAAPGVDAVVPTVLQLADALAVLGRT